MRESELKIGNALETCIEKVGDASLVLSFGFELVSKDTFYVPSFMINLIYVSCFDKLGFSSTFGDRKINLMLDS